MARVQNVFVQHATNKEMTQIIYSKVKTLTPVELTEWLGSNFIPADSKKMFFFNSNYIIRFAIKNESELKNLMSRDRRILEKNYFTISKS